MCNELKKNQTVLVRSLGVAGKIYDILKEGDQFQVYIEKSNTLILCTPRDVEPICTDVFQIGDEVEAVYLGNCGFKGVVTGFEPSTNRVICKSNVSKNDRTRWAYKVSEIAVRMCVTFDIGKHYCINDKVNVVIIGRGSDSVLLVDMQTMCVRWGNVPMTVDITASKERGINKILSLDDNSVDVNFKYNGENK